MPVWMESPSEPSSAWNPAAASLIAMARSQRHLSLVVVGYRSPEQGEKTIWASTLHSPTKALHARGETLEQGIDHIAQ